MTARAGLVVAVAVLAFLDVILLVRPRAAWTVNLKGGHSLQLLCRSGRVVHEVGSELSSAVLVAVEVPAVDQVFFGQWMEWES